MHSNKTADITVEAPAKFKTYTLRNFKELPQIKKLSEKQIFAIEVVGQVFPFKANNYVVEQLIDWDNVPNDPIFVLTFPQKGMLNEKDFEKMAQALIKGNKEEIKEVANKIRWSLNPQPAGQASNMPVLNGRKLEGMQHKYKETALFFPTQGQTCHAYCTFCFRWPQFVGLDSELKFAMKEAELLVEYVRENPTITDVLFTGGDPMIMRTKTFKTYVKALLEANLPNLKSIRIGTKSLAYWPYRYLTDPDAQELIDLFKKITDSGLQLAIMAHFNHYNELKTDAVLKAIEVIRSTGAQIRTQSPILKNINDDPKVWETMWREQANLGLIPYYMFCVRDTGAKEYFEIPLERAWNIFREAYRNVSGLCRTVRGPSMSATPGKIHILGVAEISGEKVFTMEFIQGKNSEWVKKPFFAKYNSDAFWLDDLEPAFGEEKFFFEK